MVRYLSQALSTNVYLSVAEVSDQGLDGIDDLDERKKAVLEGLRRWATYKDAAALAGVDESTVRRWRKDERFARLCRAALAVNKLEMTEVIRKAAERGDWKAALALLEKHPMTRDDFGQGPAKTNINTIRIGHLIQRDPAHKIPHMIEQNDDPDVDL